MSGLLRAAHAPPAVAVVLLSVLLEVAFGLGPGTTALVAAAVLAGQLSVGWSNDLIDLGRDQRVGRVDKPLVGGEVAVRTVRLACTLAVVAVVPLSLACGLLAGLVHLLCVASAWAYNAGMKSTLWSWAPYAFSFGGLVAFVSLAGGSAPPAWTVAAGALLGVGAHLLNVLPDLEDDAATGVRGLPHRLGPRWLPVAAVAVLAAGSVVVALGAGPSSAGTVLALVLVALLAGLALLGPGRWPFAAAAGIALVDVVLLVATARTSA